MIDPTSSLGGTPGPDRLRTMRILLVDDEPDVLQLLEELLRASGFEAVASTQDPDHAIQLFREQPPDLVVLDLHFPDRDGFELLDEFQPRGPDPTYLPILVITGNHDPEIRGRALAAGARDFLTKPLTATEVLLRIKNLLETRFLHQELRRHNETLEHKVLERTRALAEAQIEILRRLAIAAEYRDDITGQHAERVGALSALVAQILGLHRDEVRLIRRAAPLHDVGKIGIPDAILMKPGPLTDEEFEVMKGHTAIGARILSGSHYALLQVAREIAESHHERWDGGGYTPGMAGENIPLVGRIVAVADVYDSLTHRRPYKDAYDHDVAVDLIRSQAGTHFDPRIVSAFDSLVDAGQVGDLERMQRGLALDTEPLQEPGRA